MDCGVGPLCVLLASLMAAVGALWETVRALKAVSNLASKTSGVSAKNTAVTAHQPQPSEIYFVVQDA